LTALVVVRITVLLAVVSDPYNDSTKLEFRNDVREGNIEAVGVDIDLVEKSFTERSEVLSVLSSWFPSVDIDVNVDVDDDERAMERDCRSLASIDGYMKL